MGLKNKIKDALHPKEHEADTTTAPQSGSTGPSNAPGAYPTENDPRYTSKTGDQPTMSSHDNPVGMGTGAGAREARKETMGHRPTDSGIDFDTQDKAYRTDDRERDTHRSGSPYWGTMGDDTRQGTATDARKNQDLPLRPGEQRSQQPYSSRDDPMYSSGAGAGAGSYGRRDDTYDTTRDTMGRDTMGRDTMGRDTMGRDTTERDPMGRGTMGRDTMNRDPMSRDTMGRDTMGQDTMGRDTMGRDTMGGGDNMGRDYDRSKVGAGAAAAGVVGAGAGYGASQMRGDRERDTGYGTQSREPMTSTTAGNTGYPHGRDYDYDTRLHNSAGVSKTSSMDSAPFAAQNKRNSPPMTGAGAGSGTGTGTGTTSGPGHFGPGLDGSKVMHKCHACGHDNDISQYFQKDTVYRMS